VRIAEVYGKVDVVAPTSAPMLLIAAKPKVMKEVI